MSLLISTDLKTNRHSYLEPKIRKYLYCLIFTLQNYVITEAVHKVADSFKCKPVEGMLSHQLKQGKIDGEKTIIQNPNEAQRKEHEKCDFDLHEVYAIDVLVSSGEGIGREKDTKVSIFKKTEENYQLKLKASRALMTEVCQERNCFVRRDG